MRKDEISKILSLIILIIALWVAYKILKWTIAILLPIAALGIGGYIVYYFIKKKN